MWYDTRNVMILDIETSIKNKGDNAIGSMQASPYHPDNKIVLAQVYDSFSSHNTQSEYCLPEPLVTFMATRFSTTSPGILVGHNIKFDVLYCQKYEPNFIKAIYYNRIILWDTMVVEYLLTGQQSKFTSLDDLSRKYGGTIKDDKIKKYWEDGVDTEDIPHSELADYLHQDVLNTLVVFLNQLSIARKLQTPGIMDLILMEMNSLRDTILTEWNGMYVDMGVLQDLAVKSSEALTQCENTLKKFDRDLNWSSPKQLQAYLYGGTVSLGKVEAQIFDGDGNPLRYKSGPKKGKIKTKLVDDIREYKGELKTPNVIVFGLDCPFGKGTDEETLLNYERLLQAAGMTYCPYPGVGIELINTILEYRKHYKDFHTYYIGMAKSVWGTDSCIHAQFNHTGTDTGRLSSSSPNLQNITGGE